MAARPVPGQELAVLHERIGRTVAEVRFRARRQSATGARAPVGTRTHEVGPRIPDDLIRAAADALRNLRVAPRLAVGVGAALALVAGIAAVLMAWGRRM